MSTTETGTTWLSEAIDSDLGDLLEGTSIPVGIHLSLPITGADERSMTTTTSTAELPALVSGNQIVFFDVETIPDERRRPLFGLDPAPAEPEPFINPATSIADLLKKTVGQIADELAGCNPGPSWLDEFEQAELLGKKPREGVLNLVKKIRSSRQVNPDEERARIKKMSVTPEFCRIVALGLAVGDQPPIGAVAVTDEEEAGLLRWFWQTVAGATQVSGFNVLAFDLPVILLRSALLGVQPTRRFDLRPWSSDVCDLLTARFGRGPGLSLASLVQCLGLETRLPDMDGSRVYETYQQDPRLLADYVADDVSLNQQLHQMYRGFFV